MRDHSPVCWLNPQLVVALALLLKGPADPLRPLTLADGVGPVTRRRYWLEIEGAECSPEEVARYWRKRFPQHAPKWLAWFWGLDHPVPSLEQGDCL